MTYFLGFLVYHFFSLTIFYSHPKEIKNGYIIELIYNAMMFIISVYFLLKHVL